MNESDNSTDFRGKLERLEVLVDALLEERNSLKKELRQFERPRKKTAATGNPETLAEGSLKSLETLRTRLAESEAENRKLMRDRNQVRERLEQIRNRLGQVEAKLLEQRSTTTNSRG